MTDDNGVLAVKVKIHAGKPGTYYLMFHVGGVYSRVVKITTNFPPYKLVIKRQPTSSFD